MRSMFTATFNPRNSSAIRLASHRGNPSMGYIPTRKSLIDQACDAINYYMMFPDTDKESMDAKRQAVDAMKGLFKNFHPDNYDHIKEEIRKYCNVGPSGDNLLSQVQVTTPAMVNPNPPTPTVDVRNQPPPEPFRPPVRTRGRTSFAVSPREENPPPQELPPFTVSSREENPPPYEPPPPYVPPPPVATSSVGCWYVPGKGYMWGERPSSGESTGLSQSDCEAIKARDLQIRQESREMSMQAPCDTSRGQFIDPRTGQCRGSVSSFPGAPFGLPGDTGGVAAPMLSGPRRVALRGTYDNGSLEWWSYQQAFLPPLYFSRPRVNRTTLGAGKPVPAGMCCQATEDGGAICSNGHGFPPDCPNKPEPNVAGVAKRIQQEGYLVPKPPPAPVNGVCPVPAEVATTTEGSGIAPIVGIAAVGALVYAVVEGLL